MHGAKEGKDGRRRWCRWQRSAFPRRPSFPFVSYGGTSNDDHAVLLVHELIHLGTYLLVGGLHFLAVDVDGYPSGAASCHDVKFWQKLHNHPSRYGTA